MCENNMPLPHAIPGKEYVIQYIKAEKNSVDGFSGYGITPGTKIRLVFKSPSQNPAAYEIMGAVIALRNEDCKKIFITPYRHE